jgi:hypothetical protein
MYKQQGLAKSDAASYLGGLLWNLETYLHGCCFNYGYDYGSRTSPTPYEVCEYYLLIFVEKIFRLLYHFLFIVAS